MGEKKQTKIVEACNNVIKSLKARNTASIKELQQLTGKICFYSVGIASAAIRAALQPVYDTIGSAGEGETTVSTSNAKFCELLPAIFHIRELIQSAQPLELDFSDGKAAAPPIHIWSDAAEKDGPVDLGAVTMLADGKIYHFSVAIPPEFREVCYGVKEKIIALSEALLVLAALETFGKFIRNRKVFFHIDNSAALFSIMRGSSKCPLARVVAQAVRCELCKNAILSAFRYVPSKWNPADGGTRVDLFKWLKATFNLLKTTAPARQVPEKFEDSTQFKTVMKNLRNVTKGVKKRVSVLNNSQLRRELEKRFKK
jgi:hypothetical protein